ncbi:MAG: DUF935 family protein [Bacteroidetes bacterium]|nr:MAG: DUF935 family protein [Bacteroidota bacterium]
MYINSDLATKLTPELTRLAKYVQSANATDATRDVRPLMSWLMQIGQIDPHFMGLLQTRKLALTGFQRRIDMLEGLTAKDADKKRIEQIRSRMVKSGISKLFGNIVNAYIFGQGAVRLVWQNDSLLGTRVASVQKYNLTELDIDTKSLNGLLFIDTDTKSQAFTSKPLDPATHIIIRANPLDGVDENFTGSFARINMIYAWLKYDDMFQWSMANKKFGDPLLYAQYIKGADPDEIQTIVDGLDALSSSSRAAFSDDVKLNLLEAQRSGIVEMHKQFVALIEDKQSISILGQAMTTDSKVGSNYAKALAGNFVREDYLYGDIMLVQEIITDQYLAQDFAQNYSTAELCPYVLRFNVDEIGDTETNSRVILNMKDAGMKIRKDEAYRKTGFTPPAETDEILE